jgi:hypothetical protein
MRVGALKNVLLSGTAPEGSYRLAQMPAASDERKP